MSCHFTMATILSRCAIYIFFFLLLLLLSFAPFSLLLFCSFSIHGFYFRSRNLCKRKSTASQLGVDCCTAYWCVIEKGKATHKANNDINHFRACHTNKIKRVHILLPSIAFQFIYMSVCPFWKRVSECMCVCVTWMNEWFVSYFKSGHSLCSPCLSSIRTRQSE